MLWIKRGKILRKTLSNHQKRSSGGKYMVGLGRGLFRSFLQVGGGHGRKNDVSFSIQRKRRVVLSSGICFLFSKQLVVFNYASKTTCRFLGWKLKKKSSLTKLSLVHMNTSEVCFDHLFFHCALFLVTFKPVPPNNLNSFDM